MVIPEAAPTRAASRAKAIMMLSHPVTAGLQPNKKATTRPVAAVPAAPAIAKDKTVMIRIARDPDRRSPSSAIR